MGQQTSAPAGAQYDGSQLRIPLTDNYYGGYRSIWKVRGVRNVNLDLGAKRALNRLSALDSALRQALYLIFAKSDSIRISP